MLECRFWSRVFIFLEVNAEIESGWKNAVHSFVYLLLSIQTYFPKHQRCLVLNVKQNICFQDCCLIEIWRIWILSVVEVKPNRVIQVRSVLWFQNRWQERCIGKEGPYFLLNLFHKSTVYFQSLFKHHFNTGICYLIFITDMAWKFCEFFWMRSCVYWGLS